MKSLIQQRMALERARTGAVGTIALAILWLVLGLSRLGDDSSSWYPWTSLTAGAVFVLIGIRQLITALRALSVFEAEHGRDAGRQPPI